MAAPGESCDDALQRLSVEVRKLSLEIAARVRSGFDSRRARSGIGDWKWLWEDLRAEGSRLLEEWRKFRLDEGVDWVLRRGGEPLCHAFWMQSVQSVSQPPPTAKGGFQAYSAGW